MKSAFKQITRHLLGCVVDSFLLCNRIVTTTPFRDHHTFFSPYNSQLTTHLSLELLLPTSILSLHLSTIFDLPISINKYRKLSFNKNISQYEPFLPPLSQTLRYPCLFHPDSQLPQWGPCRFSPIPVELHDLPSSLQSHTQNLSIPSKSSSPKLNSTIPSGPR